jgi:propionate CoA-transferase
VDPLVRGTAQNRRTQGSLAERWDVDGVPHLFYRAPRIGAALLRATVADEDGSLALTREPIEQALLAMALAARAGGGPVLAEVRAVVRRGSLPAREVRVPGCLVDAVVVAPEAAGPDDPRLTGEWAVRPEAPPLPLTPDKVMARRALWELRPGMLVNLGFGLATLVAQVAAEEGVAERVTFSVEHGPLGGLPAGTRTFGASAGPQAILRAPDVFALYHAGLLDLAVLSAAEVDREGNANVSRFGDAMPGPGGYVDITGCTRSLVLLVALTAGGTRLEVADGGLRVAAEGRIPRFVPEVRERTFSGPAALARGARVRYVTDRCTFELRPEGLTLTEVAPGIDVRRDVLDRMGFAPRVAPVLRRWPAALFAEGPMGLQDRWG